MNGWTNNFTDLVTCNLNKFVQHITNTFCEVNQIFTGNCTPTVADITSRVLNAANVNFACLFKKKMYILFDCGSELGCECHFRLTVYSLPASATHIFLITCKMYFFSFFIPSILALKTLQSYSLGLVCKVCR